MNIRMNLGKIYCEVSFHETLHRVLAVTCVGNLKTLNLRDVNYIPFNVVIKYIKIH